MTAFQTANVVSCALLYSLLIRTIYTLNFTATTNGQFTGQTLNCTANEACYISCGTTADAVASACSSVVIICPIDYPCHVTCAGDSACDSVIIYAQHSSLFTLLDCDTGSWTCIGMELHFPPNYYGQKRANLLDFDRGFSAGSNDAKPLTFYAIYGWNDINIEPGGDHTFNEWVGTMHCTPYYNVSCAFKSNAFSCANTNDLCNDPPTKNPTLSPTQYPTNAPTNPTIDPSLNPTQSPSKYPSIYPSVTPSYSPTKYPTLIPTNTPTKYPTSNPSVTPSISPTLSPTNVPTNTPTNTPLTSAPTMDGQTKYPSMYPTSVSPTVTPTHSPITAIPTISPITTTVSPTESPITATPTPSPIPTTAIPTHDPITLVPSLSPVIDTTVSDINPTLFYNGFNTADSKGMDPLIGLIVGLVLLLGCILLLLFWYCRRTRHVQQALNHKYSETQTKVHSLKVHHEAVATMSRKSINNAYNSVKTGQKSESDNLPKKPVKLTSNPSSMSTHTVTHSQSHSYTHSDHSDHSDTDSSSNATIELVEAHTEGDTHTVPINMSIELAHLKTKSVASTAFSPVSALSGFSHIPSIVASQSKVLKDGNESETETEASVDQNDAKQQFLQQLNTFPTRAHALSDHSEWETQMNALKQMILARPGSANFAAMAHSHGSGKSSSFFGDENMNNIYANLPMSAPVMDQNMFFASANMQNNPQKMSAMISKAGKTKSIPTQIQTHAMANNALPQSWLNIGQSSTMRSEDNMSNLSSNISYLSGVPSHMDSDSNALQVMHAQTPGTAALSVIWNGINNADTPTMSAMTEQKTGDSDSSETDSDSETDSQTETAPNMGQKKPSVITMGNKTQNDSESESDMDSEYSTSVTMTMSMNSQSHNIVDSNKSNRISKHFRIPSVITDKGGMSDEEESVTNLPHLIQIDEGVQHQNDEYKGQLHMLPEQNASDNESEVTIELQLDENEGNDSLREESEEYTDSMEESKGNESGSGFEEYGGNDQMSHETRSSTVSESSTVTMRRREDTMDDDLDEMLHDLTSNDVRKSFNDRHYSDEYEDDMEEEEDEYYDDAFED